MINKLKVPLVFVAGLILGAIVTFVIAGKANQRLWDLFAGVIIFAEHSE